MFISKNGLDRLGAYLRSTRLEMGMSQDDLLEAIKSVVGTTLSKPALSALERGNSKPGWDTLSTIAESGLFINPKTGNPWTTSDLFEIACESIDPDTGEELLEHSKSLAA